MSAINLISYLHKVHVDDPCDRHDASPEVREHLRGWLNVIMAAPPTEKRMAALRGKPIRITQLKKRNPNPAPFTFTTDFKINE